MMMAEVRFPRKKPIWFKESVDSKEAMISKLKSLLPKGYSIRWIKQCDDNGPGSAYEELIKIGKNDLIYHPMEDILNAQE